jgi:putative Ca2+/H+ antiporter (TMEM165/GDT1 family)
MGSDSDSGGSGGFGDAFSSSLAMILVSELGDETFIIAAIMAMRHPRLIVFAGAIGALAVMTVLSTALGLIVPNLISQSVVNKAAFVLYTFFGFRLLYIAYRSDPNATMQEEMTEVEEKLSAGLPGQAGGQNGSGGRQIGRLRRALAKICTPIFLEAFVLTFLAEWGDRSQITTIALAAHKNPYGVTIGGILGHAFCTGLAVIGGRIIALKISQRLVAVAGGLLFFVFAGSALVYGAPGSDVAR